MTVLIAYTVLLGLVVVYGIVGWHLAKQDLPRNVAEQFRSWLTDDIRRRQIRGRFWFVMFTWPLSAVIFAARESIDKAAEKYDPSYADRLKGRIRELEEELELR